MTDCTAADCDIFSARSEPTKGRQRYSFSLRSKQYDIIDHGGHHSEQEENWVPSYSTANFIIFTVALSGYCRYAVDDNRMVSHRIKKKKGTRGNSLQNQIVDAMDAFKKVSAAVRIPILLLFTKVDIFEKLLSVYKFTDYFPSYSGPMHSSNIRGHLALNFRHLCPGSNERLFIRVVNAADPEAFRKVFEEVESKILSPRLRSVAGAESLSLPRKDRRLTNDEDDYDEPPLDVYEDYDDDPPLNAYDDEDLEFYRRVMATKF